MKTLNKDNLFDQMVLETKAARASILRKYYYLKEEEKEEIGQVMLEAIWHAVDSFDESNSKGASLKTYCSRKMEWAVMDYLNENLHAFSISSDDYVCYRKVREAFEEYPYRSLEEISKITGYSLKAVRRCLTPLGTTSLDSSIKGNSDKDDDTITLADTISTQEEEEFKYAELLPILGDAIHTALDKRSADIICKYFGVEGPKLTLEEIADLYGITHQMVSKIKAQSLATLKDYLSKRASF